MQAISTRAGNGRKSHVDGTARRLVPSVGALERHLISPVCSPGLHHTEAIFRDQVPGHSCFLFCKIAKGQTMSRHECQQASPTSLNPITNFTIPSHPRSFSLPSKGRQVSKPRQDNGIMSKLMKWMRQLRKRPTAQPAASLPDFQPAAPEAGKNKKSLPSRPLHESEWGDWFSIPYTFVRDYECRILTLVINATGSRNYAGLDDECSADLLHLINVSHH